LAEASLLQGVVRDEFFCSDADPRAVILARALGLRSPMGGSGGPLRNRHKEKFEMFSHIMIGSNDVERSKKFYDALFGAMGAQPGTVDARGRVAYSHNGGRFMISKPIDCKPASSANGGTIGFMMSDAKMAEAWHKAGVANGGRSIEDPPGVRPNGAYLAYLRDPDGNKIVGVAR
jgi:catechol 2,3-dioxygenase-like lactoylglutathione lyase family enzyme